MCRLPAYDGPGLPSPTTSQTGSVIGAHGILGPVESLSASPAGAVTRPSDALVGGLALGSPRRPRPASSSDSSRSMPTSASASASSASTSSAVGAWVTLTISVSSSSEQRRALGEHEVLGVDLGADLGALDGDLDELGDVGGLGLDRDRAWSR